MCQPACVGGTVKLGIVANVEYWVFSLAFQKSYHLIFTDDNNSIEIKFVAMDNKVTFKTVLQ